MYRTKITLEVELDVEDEQKEALQYLTADIGGAIARKVRETCDGHIKRSRIPVHLLVRYDAQYDT